MQKLAVLVTALIILWGQAAAEPHSLGTGSLEDELIEALSRGEIDQSQYSSLVEFLESGIILDRQYLIDNLSRADYIIDSVANSVLYQPFSKLESEVLINPTFRTSLNYRFSSELTEQRRSRYRLSVQSEYAQEIMIGLSLKKELSGRERFSRRYLTWHPGDAKIDRVIIGNFTERYASGLLVGYRGKILDYSDELDAESFGYPDYGGLNGVSGGGRFGSIKWRTLWSINRDREFKHTIYAAGTESTLGNISSGMNLSWNQLADRNSGAIDDYKGSLFGRYHHSRGFAAFESAVQGGEFGSSAAIIETAYNSGPVWLGGEFWHYGDNFTDLSTGSRSSSLARVVNFEKLGYNLRSRRSGQLGSVINVATAPLYGLRWENSFLAATINRDSSLVQNMLAVHRDFTSSLSMKIDFLHKTKQTSDGNGFSTNRMRVEIGNSDDVLDWRSYVGFSDGNRRDLSISMFGRCRYRPHSESNYEIWINFGKISPDRNQLDYFYGFFSSDQYLADQVMVGLKIAHRYSRSSLSHHLTTVSLHVARLIQ